MPPADPAFGAAFLAAHTEDQVASLCRTHHASPGRTAAYVAAVAAGEIRPALAPGSARERRALLVMGVREGEIGVRAPTRGYVHLKPPFLRGSLPGQLEAVHRDRAEKPGKAAEFRRAVADGAVALRDHPGLTRWHLSLLARLGVPFGAALAAAVLARRG